MEKKAAPFCLWCLEHLDLARCPLYADIHMAGPGFHSYTCERPCKDAGRLCEEQKARRGRL